MMCECFERECVCGRVSAVADATAGRHLRVRFGTSEYEFAHGRKPRGKGCWGFQFYEKNDWYTIKFAPGSLTFADAKRWAIKTAKAAGCDRVSVAT
jgi:hypothetical protein